MPYFRTTAAILVSAPTARAAAAALHDLLQSGEMPSLPLVELESYVLAHPTDDLAGDDIEEVDDATIGPEVVEEVAIPARVSADDRYRTNPLTWPAA